LAAVAAPAEVGQCWRQDLPVLTLAAAAMEKGAIVDLAKMGLKL
jgi:hypothetical protein